MATTNLSKTAQATAAKYADPTRIVSGGGGDFGGGGAGGSWDPPYNLNSDAGGGQSSSAFAAQDPRRLDLRVPQGAEVEPDEPTEVNTYSVAGAKITKDLRVRIRVPQWYLTDLTSGFKNTLKNLHGILFPYTPQISYQLKADYTPQSPLHSNFALYFYQKSSVSSISINGKFTVENHMDAENYLSTVHLLRALTRMKFGLDPDAGAPPPVCRLDAYGDMMLDNVPIAISEFRIELPEDVDYFKISGSESYGNNAVPTRSSIQVTCIPMYSRNELQQFSVNSYINSRKNSRGFI